MLPLPLELTRPVELTSSLEDSFKESFAVETTKYNHESQIREDLEGVPMILNGGGTQSQSQCNSLALGSIQVDADVVADDNDIL